MWFFSNSCCEMMKLSARGNKIKTYATFYICLRAGFSNFLRIATCFSVDCHATLEAGTTLKFLYRYATCRYVHLTLYLCPPLFRASGKVFQAKHHETGHQVAIKYLDLTGQLSLLGLIAQEISILSSVKHSNIINFIGTCGIVWLLNICLVLTNRLR